jgi:ribonuclease PH
MQHRKADNAEGKKDIINRAFNAAARTAKNIILAAKDGKITEEEFQKIVTDAHEELNKIETNKDTEIAETE